MLKYRLALDLGSTSLGWCMLALNENNQPASIIDMGVRIFPDGRDAKTHQPLAVSRRKARALRRNFDRREARQKRLMKLLIQEGLMPQEEILRKNLEQLDPYELRSKALHEKISLHHLGRALFHINQRRGFKSNRKSDQREQNVSNMKNAIKSLREKIITSGSKTLGEYLWKLKQTNEPVRVRSSLINNKAEYNLYPGREMYQEEIEEILAAQKKYHVTLTDNLCAKIKDIIFYQRKMKQPIAGKCRFESGELRIRKAHPLFQKYRILQETNHLALENYSESEPQLTPQDRQKIIKALFENKKRTFGQLRTLLNLPRGCKFNLESESRTELRGDDTAAILGSKKCFGPKWHELSINEQEDVINYLFTEDDPDELTSSLMQTWKLDQEQVTEVALAKLEDGYASISRKAIEKIIPGLEKGLTYDKAVKEVYPHHSDFRTGEIFDLLPYYGEILPNSVIGGTYAPEDKDKPEKYFGKINNPTVHIALNQVKKLINALIKKHGHPKQIVVELARDLKESPEAIKKDQTKNKNINDRINNELEKIGVKQNYQNRMRFKLWEDLSKVPELRHCPFCSSDHPISIAQLFSNECEEEHLLPFSRSFNDGRANKVIAHQYCNREKGNRTPFEAFGGDKIRWSIIQARIQNMPKNKQWRFKEEAWEIAKGQGEDIIARQLNDTRYMSKITHQYLAAVCDNQKGKNNVYTIPGQLTAMLRDKWGLNKLVSEVWQQTIQKLFSNKPELISTLIKDDNTQKNRHHHLHHAVDAVVIGCTDRGMLKKISDAANDFETRDALRSKRHQLMDNMPEPFDNFRNQIAKILDNLVISYKPDHGGAKHAIHAARPFTVSPLHDQTAYGFIRPAEKKGRIVVATRKAIQDFESIKHIEEIPINTVIRKSLLDKMNGILEGSSQWKEALSEFSKEMNIRHIRIHIEKTQDVMINIQQPINKGPQHTRGKTYKFYALGGNDRAEIWRPTKGKDTMKWQCEVISNYHAHQKNFVPNWRRENPTAKLIMRLYINDMVAYEENGVTKICRVKKINQNGKIYLRPHQIAVEQTDKLSWAASANQLQQKKSRKISVDITGNIKDPMRIK